MFVLSISSNKKKTPCLSISSERREEEKKEVIVAGDERGEKKYPVRHTIERFIRTTD